MIVTFIDELEKQFQEERREWPFHRASDRLRVLELICDEVDRLRTQYDDLLQALRSKGILE